MQKNYTLCNRHIWLNLVIFRVFTFWLYMCLPWAAIPGNVAIYNFISLPYVFTWFRLGLSWRDRFGDINWGHEKSWYHMRWVHWMLWYSATTCGVGVICSVPTKEHASLHLRCLLHVILSNVMIQIILLIDICSLSSLMEGCLNDTYQLLVFSDDNMLIQTIRTQRETQKL